MLRREAERKRGIEQYRHSQGVRCGGNDAPIFHIDYDEPKVDAETAQDRIVELNRTHTSAWE